VVLVAVDAAARRGLSGAVADVWMREAGAVRVDTPYGCAGRSVAITILWTPALQCLRADGD
jgi:hypothetical protein